MKEEPNGQLEKYRSFKPIITKQLDIELTESGIHKSKSDDQKYIHGNIFEYAVQNAAGYKSKKKDPWIKFGDLYPSMEEEEKSQYKTFMEEAGRVAWNIFNDNADTVCCKETKSSTSFERHITNDTFPILTSTLEADIVVLSSLSDIVCEIKYSTMKKDEYQQNYLVHAIVQVLIYSLVLKLNLSTIQLRILVFFSKTREAVLYESDIHKNEKLVDLLVNKLKGIHEEESIDDDMIQSLNINN